MNKEIYTKLVLVTPELAKELMNKNSSNRPLTERVVKMYSDQMIAGQWTISGQTISISDDNRLIDGQHRLSALIMANISLYMNVSYNIPFKSFVNYDSLRPRTVSDVFSISEIPNYRQAAAILSSYNLIRNNNLAYAGFGNVNTRRGASARKGDKVRMSNMDFLKLYNSNDKLFNEIINVAANCYTKIRLIKHSQIGGIMCLLIIDNKHNKEKVYSFFKQLFFNENVENKSIYNLREKLIKGNIGNYTMVPKLKYIFIVKCWNAYVLGKEIKTYSFSDSETMPTFI